MKPLRVLHCPESICGQAAALAAAERQLGLASEAVAFYPSATGHAHEQVLFAEGATRSQRERARLGLLWRAIRDFDVIHFNFGRTFFSNWFPPRSVVASLPAAVRSRTRRLPLYLIRELSAFPLDLPLLKAAGKRIVFTFQGDDIRQGDYCRQHFDVTFAREVDRAYYHPLSDAWKRLRRRFIEPFADRIYALNPDLLHVLPPWAEFLPYAHVDVGQWQPAWPKQEGRLRVIHAPTHRQVKGTRFILEAVDALKQEGLAFDFELVEGLPFEEARQRYRAADILVDQVLAGWYGGLAVEAMALGKPVISYLREDDLHVLPEQMRQELPIVSAEPQTLRDVLREALTGPRDRLRQVGEASREYAMRWHAPQRVAGILRDGYASCPAARHDTQ
jgi:glycosyltransferase involved in cell wall biosynthesis